MFSHLAHLAHFLRHICIRATILITSADVPYRAGEPVHAPVHWEVVPHHRQREDTAKDNDGVVHIGRTRVGSDGEQEDNVHKCHEQYCNHRYRKALYSCSKI